MSVCSAVRSQTGCAGAPDLERSDWDPSASLAGWEAEPQEGRESWGGGQPKAHATAGSAGDPRGELGLLVEHRAGIGGLNKEESTAILRLWILLTWSSYETENKPPDSIK